MPFLNERWPLWQVVRNINDWYDTGTFGGLQNVVEDLTPQLGGTLDVNNKTITNDAGGNITFEFSNQVNFNDDSTGGPLLVLRIADTASTWQTNQIYHYPHNSVASSILQSWSGTNYSWSFTGGTYIVAGNNTATYQMTNWPQINLGNFHFDADQTVGAGQDNYVLTYDHSTLQIRLEAGGGGVPDGTADDQALRWDSVAGAWEATSLIKLVDLNDLGYPQINIAATGSNNSTTEAAIRVDNLSSVADLYFWAIGASDSDQLYLRWDKSPSSSNEHASFYMGATPEQMIGLYKNAGQVRFMDNAFQLNNNCIRWGEASGAPLGPSAGFGQLYIKNDAPNSLWFQDDAGTDWLVSDTADVGLTANVGSSQGDGPITSRYNVYSTVANAGDAATLPATFEVGHRVHVKNDGANSMDVFPASGDNAGAGTNVAVAVAAGDFAVFMGTVANTTWTKIMGGTA